MSPTQLAGSLAKFIPGFPRPIAKVATLALAAAVIVLPVLPAGAQRGPEKIADVAENVIEAVVNISTSQTLDASSQRGGGSGRSERGGGERGGGERGGGDATPQVPPGSPFEDFFEEFFKNRRGPGQQGENNQRGQNTPRRVNSLGSGFVIDESGIVVTNNHVISEADEVTVVFTDGSRLKAEVLGRDQKTDLALLRVKPTKPLKAVKFGDSDKVRLGEWVIAIGNPFSPRRLGHRRHRVGAQPRHQFRSLRQLHPDRRVHQPRQFRRSAVQHGWRRDRREHRDHLALRRLDRHRLRGPGEDRRRRDRPAAPVRRDPPRLARRAHPAGHRRHRRKPRPETDARRADRRRRRQGPGQAGRHRARRRRDQVRRQGHQGNARPAAHRRRHAGRQGRRGHHCPQGQGRKEDREARPARGWREAAARVRQDHDAAGQGQDRRQEDARSRPRQHQRRPAQEVQDQGIGEGRRGHHRRSIRARTPPRSGCRPAM